MPKMPIPWHEECFKNNTIFLERKEKELLRLISQLNVEVKEYRKRFCFYKYQIEQAKKEKKDGFDREKYKTKGVSQCK